MYTFKNFVLKRDINNLMGNITELECGEVGGLSIEIITDDPKSFESYLYQGKSAESDRDHDLQILKTMLKKGTN